MGVNSRIGGPWGPQRRSGAYEEWPDGANDELRAPAGQLCSSFRGEMVALRSARNRLRDHPRHPNFCRLLHRLTEALATLREGSAAQKTPLGAALWPGLAPTVTSTSG